jgi:DNA-directed RNA polymerase specialized sigma subunit
MENIEQVIDNLRTIFQLRNDKEIADLLGISESNFSKMKTRNKIPYENLFLLSRNKGIDINSIIYGQNGNNKINFKEEIIKNIDLLNEKEKEYIYHLIKNKVLEKEI